MHAWPPGLARQRTPHTPHAGCPGRCRAGHHPAIATPLSIESSTRIIPGKVLAGMHGPRGRCGLLCAPRERRGRHVAGALHMRAASMAHALIRTVRKPCTPHLAVIGGVRATGPALRRSHASAETPAGTFWAHSANRRRPAVCAVRAMSSRPEYHVAQTFHDASGQPMPAQAYSGSPSITACHSRDRPGTTHRWTIVHASQNTQSGSVALASPFSQYLHAVQGCYRTSPHNSVILPVYAHRNRF